jgi:hypothetical protein
MIKNIIIALLVLCLCSFLSVSVFSVSEGELKLIPETLDFHITGGSSSKMNITLLWNGEETVDVYLSSNIAPDGIGFTVTFSDNPTSLVPNVPKNVTMNVSVDMNIMPLYYSIDVFAESIHTYDTNQYGSCSLNYAEDTSEDDKEHQDENGSTPNQQNEDGLQLHETIPKSAGFSPYYVILLCVSICVFLFLFLWKRRHNMKHR